MVTIGEFIVARIDDDEFLAEHMIGRRRLVPCPPRDLRDPSCRGSWDPRRVLASCTALRRLVLSHDSGGRSRSVTPCECGEPGAVCAPCLTLRAVAMEWADHPDYRPEWAPHPVPGQRRRGRSRADAVRTR